MKRFLLPVVTTFLFLVILASTGSAAGTTNANPDAVFAAKAKELTDGKTSDADKILAIHGFVRDEIKQCQTQWG